MKRRVFIIVMFFSMVVSFGNISLKAQNVEGQVSISGAFALYPLAVKWAAEFKKINPGVRIDVSAGGAGKGMTDVLANMVDIGMVSRDIHAEEVKRGAIGIAVAKDAVVATVNASNPAIADVVSRGLSRSAAINIWVTGKATTWAQAFGGKSKDPIRVYTRSDACGAGEVWAKFVGKKQEDLLGSGVYGDPGINAAVKQDKFGIGYNNVAYAYDPKTRKQNQGTRVVPIDLNNNGKIDADEDFYNSVSDLIGAIAAGKYPLPPARDLYFVVKGSPQNAAVKAFIKWVLSDGQKFVNDAGYVNISKERIVAEQAKVR